MEQTLHNLFLRTEQDMQYGGMMTAGRFGKRKRAHPYAYGGAIMSGGKRTRGGRGTERNFQAAANSPWNDFVRNFAKEHKTTYGVVLSSPNAREACRLAYYTEVKGMDEKQARRAIQEKDADRVNWLSEHGQYNGKNPRVLHSIRAPRQSDYEGAAIDALKDFMAQHGNKAKGLASNAARRAARKKAQDEDNQWLEDHHMATSRFNRKYNPR